MPTSAPREECALVVYRDGHAVGVYSDAIPWAELGRITAMPRASHVEFDPGSQQWVARDAASGAVIAADPRRDVVLRNEHQHYVQALLAARFP